MRTVWLTLLMLLLGVGLGFAEPIPKVMRERKAVLDGHWQWTSNYSNGTETGAPHSDYCVWEIEGKIMTLAGHQGGRREPCDLECEKQKDGSMTFNYLVQSNRYHRKGYCRLVGDELWLCFSNNDVAKACDPNSTESVMYLKRIKK